MSTWPNRGASGGPCGGLIESETEQPSDHPGLTQANRPPRKPVRFKALEKVDSYSVIQPEGGLFGRLLYEIQEESGIKGSLSVLDRLTLCLVRMGRGEEARALTKHYFEKYRADEREPVASLIKKRAAEAAAEGR